MISIKNIQVKKKNLDAMSTLQTIQGTSIPKERLFITLTNDNGQQVESECVTLENSNYTEENITITEHILKNGIIPLIEGHTFEHPEEVHDTLLQHYPNQPIARSCIEMGVWALSAKQMNITLRECLGGTNPQIPAGYVCFPETSPKEIAKQVLHAKEEGYYRAKIKTTKETDIAILEAVRKVCPDFPIWIDGNESYDIDDIEHITKLEEYQLMMIEQPFKRGEWKAYKTLCRSTQTLICHDESIQNLEDVYLMLQHRAGEIICLKPSRVGGFTESLAIHTLCAQAGIPIWIGGMYETNIGKEYTTALASLDGVRIPGDFSKSGTLYNEENQWKLTNGYIHKDHSK